MAATQYLAKTYFIHIFAYVLSYKSKHPSVTALPLKLALTHVTSSGKTRLMEEQTLLSRSAFSTYIYLYSYSCRLFLKCAESEKRCSLQVLICRISLGCDQMLCKMSDVRSEPVPFAPPSAGFSETSLNVLLYVSRYRSETSNCRPR